MSNFSQYFPIGCSSGGGGTEINGSTYYGATTLKAMPRMSYCGANQNINRWTTEGSLSTTNPANTNIASSVNMTNNTTSQQVVNTTAGANGSAMTSLLIYNQGWLSTAFTSKLATIEFIIDSVSTTFTNQPVVKYPFGNRNGAWIMGTHYMTNTDNAQSDRYLTPGGLPTDNSSDTSNWYIEGTPSTLQMYTGKSTPQSYMNLTPGPVAVSSGHPWILYNTSLVINVQSSSTDAGGLVVVFSGHDFD